MDWLWRGVASGTVSFAWSHWVLPALLPLGASVATIVLGLSADARIPLMYIWIGTLVSFAATSGGILWFVQTVEKYSVKDRLNFAVMRVGRNIRGSGMFLGVTLQNSSGSPIEFEVEEIRTKINNIVPAKSGYDKSTITIPAGGSGWFDDHVIDIGSPPKPGTLEGFADFKFKYGRPGKRRYPLRVKKQVTLAFNSDGLFQTASSNDAN